MSTSSSKIQISQEVIDFATKTFKLCISGQSGFKKDGTGEGGVPAEFLRFGKTLLMEPISRLYLGAGNGYMPTQYVVGANTIYVNDYYEDADGKLVLTLLTAIQAKDMGYQYRPGLKSQGFNLKDEYARSYEKGICFENGEMNLGKYGDDPMLLKFFMEHEQNIAAPRAKENKDPKRLKLFTFQPLLKEQEASKSTPVENFDANLDAMVFVSNLRTQKSDKTFVYNEPKLDAVLSILDDGNGLTQGEVVQKFRIIAGHATRNGAAFMQIVNEVMSAIQGQIKVAEDLKVLSFSASEVKMLNETRKESIYTFSSPGLSKKECIEDLTLYFLGTQKGQNDYNELSRFIEQAKIKAIGK